MISRAFAGNPRAFLGMCVSARTAILKLRSPILVNNAHSTRGSQDLGRTKSSEITPLESRSRHHMRLRSIMSWASSLQTKILPDRPSHVFVQAGVGAWPRRSPGISRLCSVGTPADLRGRRARTGGLSLRERGGRPPHQDRTWRADHHGDARMCRTVAGGLAISCRARPMAFMTVSEEDAAEAMRIVSRVP